MYGVIVLAGTTRLSTGAVPPNVVPDNVGFVGGVDVLPAAGGVTAAMLGLVGIATDPAVGIVGVVAVNVGACGIVIVGAVALNVDIVGFVIAPIEDVGGDVNNDDSVDNSGALG
ncbi:MAG: hypothetical protein HQL61_18095, partial [Magnetococcales bacterium]|nr:hypothetical protein [Nitrospirota bacterium]